MPTNTNITYELLTLRQDTNGQAGHWQVKNTSPYSKNEGDGIVESNSSNATEPTSIPSPFARMELANTAFDVAAQILRKKVKGDDGKERDATWNDIPRRYQKIVSDCLDVAEIFFNYPLYSKNIEIIKWNKSDLKNIQDTELGKALIRFLDSDDKAYNFDRMDAIYLLNYIGANRPNRAGLNIIGVTSPITLFFSVDNDLSYVKSTVHFTNGDNPFDGDFNPLEKRDPSFVKYLNLFIQTYGKQKFADDFTALYNYIVCACNRLPQDVNINGTYDYEKIELKSGSGEYVTVLGQYLGCQAARQPEKSDFEIKSSLKTTGKLPLVLPVGKANGYKDCAYISVNDKWLDNVAPQRENKNLEDRVLPGISIKYPYLTVSDFFEDTIIKMPYKLNSDSYFNGKVENELEESYLLPLKPLFFEYFTTEELKSMIKMQHSGTIVKLSLEIPIKNYSGKAANPYVVFEKTYQTTKNEANNIGDTVEADFGLGVLPIVRPHDINTAHYRVALFEKSKGISLRFFDQTEQISLPAPIVRREECDLNADDKICGIETYVIQKRNFDRIDVVFGKNHGFIIPNFKDTEGSNKFRFAVDFGTSNTHIAYSVINKIESKAFECKVPQMARLHDNYKGNRDIIQAFDDNFVPNQLSFPIRSAFAERHGIKYADVTYTLGDGNIPFSYEQVGPRDYLEVQTGDDLKWSANEGRIRLYIRNIAYVLHNKVLLENGNLKETEIRWFYPASMSEFVRGMMEKAWIEAYKDFFDASYDSNANIENIKIWKMSESIAPYCHYFNKDGAKGIVATIDVGGGTTDVYVKNPSETDNDGMLLSFRCASNAIFGDGYNNNMSNNGFVSKYKKPFEEELQDSNDLAEAMRTIAQKGNSAELVSFFFSLSASGKPGLDFMQKLVKDERFKYVFVIFYSAIIYHVAQTMKAKGIEKPQTVAFSGNGSRTLQVISPSHAIQTEFVKSIFEKVYGEKYPPSKKFQLKFDNDKPKEATANGGLEAKPKQIEAKPEFVALLGNDNTTFVDKQEFDKLSETIKKGVVQNVIAFIDFIPSLNANNEFGDKFGMDVSIFDNVLEICKQDLDSYLELGLQKVLAINKTKNKNVTESLFFFPIVGMLNNLAQELYDIDDN